MTSRAMVGDESEVGAIGIGMVKVLGVFGLLVGGLVALPVTSASAASSATVRNTPIGALLVKLKDPAATSGDYFGYSVAVSGTTAVVGADRTNSLAGAAYIYMKGASGWPTTPTVTLSNPAEGDGFGFSVAVSRETAIVGAPGTNSGAGAAYIYVKGASGWRKKPTASMADPKATSGDLFGYSVAVSGTTAVVGAEFTNSDDGAAYIYAEGSSGWPTTPTVTLSNPAAGANDFFGSSVAVSEKTAVVGVPGTNNGVAYIYAEGSSGWRRKPTATLSDPAATEGDGFGYSVAVSDKTLVVGAVGTKSYAGVAYIYVKGASGWPTTPTTTLKDPAATADDSFGSSVAVSGTTAVVGAPGTSSDAGAAYIYVKGASGWPKKPTASLADLRRTMGDQFGDSVAVSKTTAAVGAYGTSSSRGAAYIYKAPCHVTDGAWLVFGLAVRR